MSVYKLVKVINIRPVIDHDRNYTQESKATNGNSFKLSKKQKHSKKEKPSEELSSKPSLNNDAHNPNEHTQFVDNISDDNRRRKMVEAVEAPD